MRSLATVLVRFYQKFISSFMPMSCRFYPSCSEYALWQFQNNSFFKAFGAVIARILRCNQLFKGGIDYPLVKRDFRGVKFNPKNRNVKPKFWFVPYKDGRYYIIKRVDKDGKW
ncbi:MAG: membrane protein insertion efficiency factor YidD [Campylobacter sp.]|nr:membrane protein insertion efficiency factor YidD [Campylobacter sp.]